MGRYQASPKAIIINFNPCIGLDVSFIGEEAQDVWGGPLREFFTLLWPAIARDSSIFTGPKGVQSLTHNMLLLKSNDYVIVGTCVSLALVYGGSGPHFFSHSLASYIFNEPMDNSFITDVLDYDVQENIHKVGLQILIYLIL